MKYTSFNNEISLYTYENYFFENKNTFCAMINTQNKNVLLNKKLLAIPPPPFG